MGFVWGQFVHLELGLELTHQVIALNGLNISGWWFGCHQCYFPIYWVAIIIPIDEVIFFRGVNQPPIRYEHPHGFLAAGVSKGSEGSETMILVYFFETYGDLGMPHLKETPSWSYALSFPATFETTVITLLRVIPTMAFNSSHLTIYLAYLSGILSGITSDILPGISSDILSGILSDILSGILSDILSGISF